MLSIDWEEWFQTKSITSCAPRINKHVYGSRIHPETDYILQTLREYDAKATFFVVGDLAKKHPGLLKKIDSEGHEIAFHSMNHFDVDIASFRDDLTEGKKIIADIIGKDVVGFRAPSWSIPSDQKTYFSILAEQGFIYDSSDIFKKTDQQHIVSIPPSGMQVGSNVIPYSGGVFFRALPFFVIKYLIIRQNNKDKAALVYFHPWEFDQCTPRVPLPIFKKVIHYYGKSTVKEKFKELLSTFRFNSIKNVHFG